MNRNGDNIPPCLTPFVTLKTEEIAPSHLTWIVLFEYQNINCLTVKPGTLIIVDAKLNWSEHVDNILDSVGKLCDVFIKLKRIVDRKILTDTYFAFVRPKLEYACIVWDDCSETDKTKLEDMPLRFARAVTEAKRGTRHQIIYNEVGWPLLSESAKNVN